MNLLNHQFLKYKIEKLQRKTLLFWYNWASGANIKNDFIKNIHLKKNVKVVKHCFYQLQNYQQTKTKFRKYIANSNKSLKNF